MAEEDIVIPDMPSEDDSLSSEILYLEHLTKTMSEVKRGSSKILVIPKAGAAGVRECGIRLKQIAGRFISEDELGELQNLAVEQEQALKLLMNMSGKIKQVVEDVQGRNENVECRKWPTRHEIAIIVISIMALFVLIATFVIKSLYPPPVPTKTWFDVVAGLGNRFIRFFK